MKRIRTAYRLAMPLATLLAALTLSACGGSGNSSSGSPAAATSSASSSVGSSGPTTGSGSSSGSGSSGGSGSGSSTTAPTISGTPVTSVTAGQKYSFTPTAQGPAGTTLTFAISNKPTWAVFSASSGALSGTPADTNSGTYSNVSISVSDGSATSALPPFSINVAQPPVIAISGAPLVLYTDVASGPNSGGENNEGAYLSIFGKNFGTTGLGSTVKVYIGGAEVNNYRYLGPSHGRPDIEQITVQVGSLGNPTPGTALPIEVVVNGVDSNTSQTFTVNPGRMLFVSQSGNDATAVAGDINHPYRHVQNGSTGAFDHAEAGDTIVVRGTPLGGAALTSDPTPASSAWTDLYNGYFLKFIDRNGSAPTGASGTGPIALIAYPDEDAYIYEAYASGVSGAISGVDASSYVGGLWDTVADLRIESGGDSGVVNEQCNVDHWRVVNNEITAVTGSSDPDNKAAGIDGCGTNSFWVGNYIHDINSGASSMTMHGIYIGGAGSYEVAYNWIDNVTDGSGFQAYNDEGKVPTTSNVSFHHNMIYNVVKYGINIADGSSSGFVVYDNVVYGAQYGCLRFNTDTLQDAKVYNNTFYNCSTHGGYGVVVNDWSIPSNGLDMENNIFYAANGGTYSGGANGMTTGLGTVTHNFFYGGVDGDSWDAAPVSGNPLVLSLTTPDFHLQAGSPAIGAGSTAVASVVTTDYELNPRSSTSIDIGAYTH